MSQSRRATVLWVALLGSLILIASLMMAFGGLVGAQEPRGTIGAALRSRLEGHTAGLWVGQVDPRAFVAPGEPIEYLVYYRNDGPAVSDAMLVDILPVGTLLESLHPEPDHPYAYDPANRRMVLTLGDVPTGVGGLVRIVAIVRAVASPDARLANTAQTWVGERLVDWSVSAATIVQAPRVEVSLVAATALRRCSVMAYTLTYTNTGNLGASNLTVTVSLPDDFLYLESPGQDQPEVRGNQVVWRDLRGLATDEVRTIPVRAMVAETLHNWPGTLVTATAVVTTQVTAGVAFTSVAAVSGSIENGPCPTWFPQVSMFMSTFRDSYEPDDSPREAVTVTVDGQASWRTFHKPADEDWLRFLAEPGRYYRVGALDLETRSDPIVSVYSPRLDPLSALLTGTLVCRADITSTNALSRAVTCCLETDTRGWYFVQVRQADPQVLGHDTGYQLRVTEALSCTNRLDLP